MSTESNQPEGGQVEGDLFGERIADARAGREAPRPVPDGEVRLRRAVREQAELRVFDLEASVPADHPVRAVWAFVQALDVSALHAGIRSRTGHGGTPATDPAILVALWLWATIDGVGSAREIDRLCERDDAYRWICGGVGMNYHTLADFRTEHAAWLQAQLTASMVALLDRRLVTLNVVSQDGLRVRAAAKASSMRRRERLQMLHAQARAQLEALRREVHEDAGASSRRKRAAAERGAREREQRLAAALAELETIRRLQAKEQAREAARQGDGDEPPSPPPGGDASAPGAGGKKAPAEPRASSTDAQARVMKMADGGFRPAFNAQLAVDAATQLIAAVSVSNAGTDMQQMAPMHAALTERYKRTPQHWLADGGFTALAGIEALDERGTAAIAPAPRARKQGSQPYAPKRGDSEAVRRWRARMLEPATAALYKLRGASVECANAQLRRRGLQQFNVRGLHKAKAVLLWHALAHNLMRMRSLGFALKA
jgi:transposase